MFFKRIELLYYKIDQLNPKLKTMIIIGMSLILMQVGYKNQSKEILRDYTNEVIQEKNLAEQYTQLISPKVNSYIESILNNDKEASNVLLLNYHNTLISTHGLSYRYLTSLVEKKRTVDTKRCIRIWKELEYINYGDELKEISEYKFLRIDTLQKYERKFPNLTELIYLSQAKSAAFYPILGIDNTIGMIVVLYPNNKTDFKGYYPRVIAPVIQPLALLLNYNLQKDKFKEMQKDGISDVDKLLKIQ